MSLSYTVLHQVLVMFLLMIVGAFCFKKKFINEEGKNQLTLILLYIVNPMLVINAYQTPFNNSLAKNLFIAFGLGFISHVIALIISYLFVHKKNNEERAPIERFAIIYSNCGFMAFPLIQALYGSEGVFYASAYITVFNILSWTHGYIIMSGKVDKKAVLKAFVSPVIISVVIGIAMFFLKIQLPAILFDTVSFLASLNTPLAMLVTGVSLAQINIISAFKSKRYYYIMFLMNILVPLCAALIYVFIPLDEKLVIVNLISTACPCAVTTLLFATKFERDPSYAAKLLTIGNVTCIITIPLIIFIYQTLSKII